MNITVCNGSSCHLKGSRRVVEELQRLAAEARLEEEIRFAGAFCMGNCRNGVCVRLDGEPFSLHPDQAPEFVRREVLPRLRRDGPPPKP